jgi:hypothetical protein
VGALAHGPQADVLAIEAEDALEVARDARVAVDRAAALELLLGAAGVRRVRPVRMGEQPLLGRVRALGVALRRVARLGAFAAALVVSEAASEGAASLRGRLSSFVICAWVTRWGFGAG